MNEHLTPDLISRVLKLPASYCCSYSKDYKNIKLVCKDTNIKRFISIHEFVYTHCIDFLVGYSNGMLSTHESVYEKIDNRNISTLRYTLKLTVPNLMDGGHSEHIEPFESKALIPMYAYAVKWLIVYRESNPQLSKYWINKL